MEFDPNMTKEEFEDNMKRLDELLRKKKELNSENAIEAKLLADKVPHLAKHKELYVALLKDANAELKAKQNASKAEKKLIKDRIARYRALTQAMNKASLSQLANDKRFKELQKEATKLAKALPDLEKRIRSTTASSSKFGESTLQMKEGTTLVGISTRVLGSSLKGLEVAFDKLTSKTALLAVVMGRQGFAAIRNQAMRMGKEIDDSFRNIMKQGFNMGKNLEQSFVAAIDPISGIKDGIVDASRASNMFIEVGITAAESGKALLALKQNSNTFTESFIANNKGITAETTNLVAGLTKIGISADSSTKAIDLFTKVLKQSPKSALKSTKSLVSIADSLDISVGQAFQNFNSLMPDLAQFGDRAVEVFGNLSAQARATGIEVGKLSKVAMGLDTFQGAAKAAQGLNAVLGSTMISVTDLVHAEPHEKIDLLRNAFDQAGVTFDTSHRRVKSLVASLLGVDVATASRMFGSKEEYDSVRQGLDTTAASHAEMTKKIEDSMTAGDIMKKSLSSLAGGMHKLVKIGRTTAKEASNLLSNSFHSMGKNAKDSGEQVLAMVAALGKLETMAAAKGKVVAGTATAAVVASEWEAVTALLKKEGSAALPHIEKLIGTDLNGDGIVGPKQKTKKAKDLTIFSDGTTYEADKQDNLFLRKDPGVAGGDGAQLFEKLDSLVAAFEEAAKTPIILQQTNEGVILASTEHTIDLLRRKVLG